MERRLLLLGGGHANLPLIQSASRWVNAGAEVTLVSPAPYHYYSGMGPGMLGGRYAPQQIRFPISQMIEAAGGRFVEGVGVRIDAAERVVHLSGGYEIAYDVLVCNTGSVIAPTVRAFDAQRFRVKPISELVAARRWLEERGGTQTRVVVVGSGPAAVEVAANAVTYGVAVTLLCNHHLLPGFPAGAARRVRRSLCSRGVVLMPNASVSTVDDRGVTTQDGRTFPADMVLQATGVVPGGIYRRSGLPVGPDGALAVNEHLQALGHPEIFGGGDGIWFTPRSLPRAGVFAVREGPILLHNVSIALGARGQMRRFRPQRRYLLLLNLGNDAAMMYRRVLGIPFVFAGHTWWRLKDFIDRRFMTRFRPD